MINLPCLCDCHKYDDIVNNFVAWCFNCQQIHGIEFYNNLVNNIYKEKMKNYTDITVLLDRSGSMASIKEKMESGFREFLSEHRKNPSTRMSLIQFNSVHRYDPVYLNRPIASVEDLVLDPQGGTPLIDAFVKTIDDLGIRLKSMPDKDRPKRVLFVVITDGEENASFLHKKEDVKRRVKEQSDKYNWQFVFLGANQDAISEGVSYGFNIGSSVNFAGVEAYSAMQLLGTKTAAYASTGDIRSLNYSDDERKSIVSTSTTAKTT